LNPSRFSADLGYSRIEIVDCGRLLAAAHLHFFATSITPSFALYPRGFGADLRMEATSSWRASAICISVDRFWMWRDRTGWAPRRIERPVIERPRRLPFENQRLIFIQRQPALESRLYYAGFVAHQPKVPLRSGN
jgi:hypothetical protein